MADLVTIRFPVLRSVAITGYALFPGNPEEATGIDHKFENGVSIIAGINGLGKTTLLNALLRLLVGPWDVLRENPDDVGSTQHTLILWRNPSYFSARVPDSAASATISGQISFGEETIYVVRNLRDLSIQQLRFGADEVTASEAEYQRLVTQLSGVSDYYDFHFLVRNLLFYMEDRRPLVWSESGQFEIARILFVPGKDSISLSALYDEIKTADSRYRNLLTESNRLVSRLNAQRRAESARDSTQAQIATLKIEYLSLEASLESIDQELESAVEAEQASADEIRRSELELETAFREYQGLQQSFFAHAFPDTSETFQYILAHIISEAGCLVCGSSASERADQLRTQVNQGICPVCGSPPNQQEQLADGTQVAAERINRASKDVDQKQSAIRGVRAQNTALQNRVESLLGRRGNVAGKLRETGNRLAALGARLPASSSGLNELEASVRVSQESLSELRKDRSDKITRYRKMLSDVSDRIETAVAETRIHFQDYVQHFLAESCELNFRYRRRPIGEGGETVNLPGVDVMMTSGVFSEQPRPRESRDDISESQKEFVDLAFRMALIRTAAPENAGAMMILETPEASLDSLFTYRAGSLLRRFAEGGGATGNVVIATSNLNDANMIPALLGIDEAPQTPSSVIDQHMINLLDLAAPNAALRDQGNAYRAQYKKATTPNPQRVPWIEGR